MVKVKSSVGIIKGKAGNMSYFEVNGETIGRSFHTSIKNPKTEAQMKQRIKNTSRDICSRISRGL